MKHLYSLPDKTVVTAHRGFSGQYPENTVTAFEKAVDLGVDFVEFDVRATSEGKLVIIHDSSLNRTTDGDGPISERGWAEVSRLNATYWEGPQGVGRRHERPQGEDGIPTLRETLGRLSGRVGLNIQVKLSDHDSLGRIAWMYLDHDLSQTGFLMLDSFESAEWIRRRFPRVAICVGEDRGDIERHLAFGVDYMQPSTQCLSDAYLERLHSEGLPYNVFYANDDESIIRFLNWGVRGIMSDYPDRVFAILASRQKGLL